MINKQIKTCSSNISTGHHSFGQTQEHKTITETNHSHQAMCRWVMEGEDQGTV